MHEWSLAMSLIEEAGAEARRRGALKVHSITVRVGALTGVVPELLGRAYEVARTGTIFEGADLHLHVEPARASCPTCGEESEFDDFYLVCPSCGGIGLRPMSGEGLVLTRMDIEIPEEDEKNATDARRQGDDR